MAIIPAQAGITRDQVMTWIAEWRESGGGSLDDYIRACVNNLGGDLMIRKAVQGDNLADIHAADLIIDDLESYGVLSSSS